MTEAQASELARALLQRATAATGAFLEIATVLEEEIKNAIMQAYNDGWEGGYEEGKEDMR